MCGKEGDSSSTYSKPAIFAFVELNARFGTASFLGVELARANEQPWIIRPSSLLS